VSGGRDVVEVESVQGTVDVRGARGRIEIGSVNADVTGTDLTGEIEVEAVNGNVTLKGIESGNVETSTVNGHIEYEGTIQDGGFYGFNSHNGGVTLRLPSDAGAEVEVSTFSGSFESDFQVTLERGDMGKQFSFTLGSGGARIEIETFNGTVRLVR